MKPFLLKFAVPPEAPRTVRLSYDAATRLNRIEQGGFPADGTLITKSIEAADASEVAPPLEPLMFEGTLLTCTREARDATEVTGDILDASMALLSGTKKTGTGEQSDPDDAATLYHPIEGQPRPAKSLFDVATRRHPWPLARYMPATDKQDHQHLSPRR